MFYLLSSVSYGILTPWYIDPRVNFQMIFWPWGRFFCHCMLNPLISTKREGFNFLIVNSQAVYGVYIFQLIKYSRAYGSYHDFIDKGLLLKRILPNKVFIVVKSLLGKLCGCGAGTPEFTSGFIEVSVAQTLFFCIVFSGSFFVGFFCCLFLLAIVLTFLRITTSNYTFSILYLSLSAVLYNYICYESLWL